MGHMLWEPLKRLSFSPKFHQQDYIQKTRIFETAALLHFQINVVHALIYGGGQEETKYAFLRNSSSLPFLTPYGTFLGIVQFTQVM